MATVLFFLIGGLVAGWILRKRNNMVRLADRLLNVAIWALLFLLGVEIGQNQSIISQIRNLGLQAAGITFFTLAGTMVAAVVCYKIFFKSK